MLLLTHTVTTFASSFFSLRSSGTLTCNRIKNSMGLERQSSTRIDYFAINANDIADRRFSRFRFTSMVYLYAYRREWSFVISRNSRRVTISETLCTVGRRLVQVITRHRRTRSLCLHSRRAVSKIVKVNATYTEVGQIARADRTYVHYAFHGA